MKRLSTASLLVSGAIVLCGCTQAEAGPLEFGGDGHASICAPASIDKEILIGDIIAAPANQSVRLRSITLVDPHGLQLEQSYLLSLNGSAIGTATYPPTSNPNWRGRVIAEGAMIEQGDQKNLVILLKRTGSVATAKALQIEYTSGGSAHVKAGTTNYSLAEHCR